MRAKQFRNRNLGFDGLIEGDIEKERQRHTEIPADI